MHIPLTPEANLLSLLASSRQAMSREKNLLNQLLGLDIAHAMDTGDTITIFQILSAIHPH